MSGEQRELLSRPRVVVEAKDAEIGVLRQELAAERELRRRLEPRWAQVIDVEMLRNVTEWALPGLSCPCCGTVTFADPPPGLHAGAVSYGPVLNTAAVLLACYGNVPPERAAAVMGMLLGVPVSAGWVDKAG